jgi:hypothetical protein
VSAPADASTVLCARHKRLDMASAHALHTASGNPGSRESVERKGVGVSILAVFLQGVMIK